ncbi:MAG: amylo-alpha-1,6-glucosidase [Acidimicrobiia bacterium]|nr:amylo-alpha-1,6-glucosidase [Acidimicrobiia bacterium]
MNEPWTESSSASLTNVGDLVTLVDESTFCISDSSGDIAAGHPHGLFFRDTRFVSGLTVRLNGQRLEPLDAVTVDPFSGTFVSRIPPPAGRADSALVVLRHRHVGHGMREDLTIRNFATEPVECILEIEVECDFADLFDVKAGRSESIGPVTRDHEDLTIVFAYRKNGFVRATRFEIGGATRVVEGIAIFEVVIPSRGEWSTCLQVVPVVDDEAVRPRHPCGGSVEHAVPATRLAEWRRRLPGFTSQHDDFTKLLARSTDALASLRIFDPQHPRRSVVAAGAPWFMTLFGRDSLLTSWMALTVDRELALGTLRTLAEFQGKVVDARTEEQPGRILHEMRFGERAQLSLGGGSVYYGTADATPLFVMLLDELERWGADRAAIDALVPAADRALVWIDEFGDRDGDGYVEYQRATETGLENQGWKDSWDSTRFADGQLATSPIALCEVQAYVYAAWRARARIARRRGDDERAASCDARAAELKRAFNRDFWIDERGWYAMGLDRDKRQLDALTSNMGHCLWAGIIDDERVPAVAAHLRSSEMFTGWGIRTLASTMAGYNPLSYHNGSVWPHDTAICVAGLARSGFWEDASSVTQGVVSSAAHAGHLLPELFAGVARDDVVFPIRYPTACSPQAWAAAAPLLLVRALLGLEVDVPAGRIQLAPSIPEWLGELHVHGIRIGDGQLSLVADSDGIDIVEAPPGVTIERSRR